MHTISPSPSAVSCKVGYYCDFNRTTGFVTAQCPAGTFGNSTQLRTPECSGPCPAGFFCPTGTYNYRFFPCPPGTYCPGGNALPLACPVGLYCAAAGLASPSGPCKDGYFCPNVTCVNTPDARGRAIRDARDAADWSEALEPQRVAGAVFPGLPGSCAANVDLKADVALALLSLCPPTKRYLPDLPCSRSSSDDYALNNSWCPPAQAIRQCPASGVIGAVRADQAPCPPGTTNYKPGGDNLGACLPCPIGTFSGETAYPYPLCPGSCVPGKYGRAAGQTSEALACGGCAPGRYTSVAGSVACAACQPGGYAAASNSSACDPCPPGAYLPTTGSTDAAECVPCGQGAFNPLPGQAACAQCPKGFFSNAVGAVQSHTCEQCPNGTYTAATGATSEDECAPLPYPCPPGQEGRLPPYPLQLADCTPIACSAPLAANLSAAGIATGCAGCGPGRFFNLSAGNASAPPDPAAPTAGAPAPAPSASPRATLSGTGSGSGTASGTAAPSAPPANATGSASSSSTASTTASPLASPSAGPSSSAAPSPSPTASALASASSASSPEAPASAGAAGSPTASASASASPVSGKCWPCPPGPAVYCPGLTTQPIVNLSEALGAGSSSSSSSSCVLAGRALQQLAPPRDTLPQGPAVGLPGGIVTALTLGVLAATVAVAVALLMLLWSQPLLQWLEKADSLSKGLSADPSRGVTGDSIMRFKCCCAARCPGALDSSAAAAPGRRCTVRAMGGACTALSHLSFLAGAVYYLTLYWSLDNVTVGKTVGIADGGSTGAFADGGAFPFLATAGGQAPPLPGSLAQPLTGLRVRVLAQGNAGACSAPQWSASSGVTAPAPGAPWAVTRVAGAACGPPESPLAEFFLDCPQCAFSAAATLKFTLHYSCQALAVEVLAAGPALPPALCLTQPLAALTAFSAANALGNQSVLLSGLALSVSVARGLVYDRDRGAWRSSVLSSTTAGLLQQFVQSKAVSSVQGKGYIVLGGVSVPQFQPRPTAALAAGALAERSSAVLVTVDLALDASYSVTTVSLQLSLVAVLATIVGLGGLYGAFGLAFTQVATHCADKKDKGGAGGGGGGGGGEESEGGAEGPGSPGAGRESSSSSSSSSPRPSPSSPNNPFAGESKRTVSSGTGPFVINPMLDRKEALAARYGSFLLPTPGQTVAAAAAAAAADAPPPQPLPLAQVPPAFNPKHSRLVATLPQRMPAHLFGGLAAPPGFVLRVEGADTAGGKAAGQAGTQRSRRW